MSIQPRTLLVTFSLLLLCSCWSYQRIAKKGESLDPRQLSSKLKAGDKCQLILMTGKMLNLKVTEVDSNKLKGIAYEEINNVKTKYAFESTWENLLASTESIRVSKFSPGKTVVVTVIVVPVTLMIITLFETGSTSQQSSTLHFP